MTWSIATWAKLLATMTLVFAALFFAPVADAAICMPEPPSAHASADHDPAKGDHDGAGVEHGLCAHGHCHHAGTARTEAIDAAAPILHTAVRRMGPRDDVMASLAPEGLIRPPRA